MDLSETARDLAEIEAMHILAVLLSHVHTNVRTPQVVARRKAHAFARWHRWLRATRFALGPRQNSLEIALDFD